MVIAVIALLMAVLLPMMGRVRKQAKSVVCQSNLRQWGIAFSAHVGDHDGRMPGHVWGTPGSASWLQWILPRETYTTHYEDILLCPMARDPHTSRLSELAWWTDELSERRIVGSYGYNIWLTDQSYRPDRRTRWNSGGL